MFKRIEKRIKRKEKEEELGLDEEMKDIMGFNDTDSDESDSESDIVSGDEQGEGAGDEDEDNADHFFGFAGEEGDGGESDLNGAEGQDSGLDEADSVTIGEALNDPIYVVSIQPDVRACIVCPGRVLKEIKMVELHQNSNAHKRRMKQFQERVKDAHPTQHAIGFVGFAELQANSQPSEISKRAEKKAARAAKNKVQRERRKKAKTLKEHRQPHTTESQPNPPSSSPTKLPQSFKEQKPKTKKLKASETVIPSEAPGKSPKKRKLGTQAAEDTQGASSTKPSQTTDVPKKKRKLNKDKDIHTNPSKSAAPAEHAPTKSAGPTKKRKQKESESESSSTPSVKSLKTDNNSKPLKPQKEKEANDSQSPADDAELSAAVKDIIRSATARARKARAAGTKKAKKSHETAKL